ncbi:SDR family NAD(P)-dependent oxidoreductase [Dolichospermum sp. ST_sed1]|nr:SDR family NAD(P)-dependent oxidoreductase [Dolichospermum sp. ST_sed1]MDD1425913.1 SDR family NAD(P)-dependent oxidoreductase [Dolichospermum sp. ST_sed9]MDD1430945.1 SDR family NAD(P)-dependent oxidoreductase [Dolichospermum sp. ST_sed6]MDD1437904.1 SDR family NAD(P)-dependent oxidoreductase [Dolichospermum sp. ST_sed10]MDD1443388.1 SDR family NAD(P)-dependent oxidoreductase [Dolichospermum sp. ST_sed3]MDD1449055.1 SDR family NAD(P)-dependent oxidoreductase [Dolichospermum sp. ST_sed8]MD
MMMKTEKWNAENILSQKGRIVIVTGSSSGIGYETARVLANKQASVIIAVRNLDKGNKALAKIIQQNKDADVQVMELDLANLASVKNFTENFQKNYSRLDLLINNAGVMIPPYAKTTDGFELQFGTNHLGHFALTGQLLKLLISTNGSRIVNVSSGAHNFGKIDFDDLNWEKRNYAQWTAYGDSKLANLYFTYELNRKLKEQGINTLVTASHPGWTATELQRTAGDVMKYLNGIFAQDITMGALPTLRAAIEEGLKGAEYFGPNGLMEIGGYPVKVESNELSKDRAIAQKLWVVSEKLTSVKFEFNQKT